MTVNGKSFDVVDCQVGAVELASGELYVGQAIPVKRDTEGWAFVVVHVLPFTDTFGASDIALLDVDKEYQLSLSRGHSAGTSHTLRSIRCWRRAIGVKTLTAKTRMVTTISIAMRKKPVLLPQINVWIPTV